MAERGALGHLTAARWFDPALAALLTAVPLVQMFTASGLASSPGAAALLVLVGVAVVVRRTHPVAGACATAALVLASSGFDRKFPPDSASVLVLVLCYSCGAHASKRAGLLAIAALAVAMQARMGLADFPNVEILFMTLAPWWAGSQVAARRRLVSELAARNRELEAEQDAYARLSVRRERARIARELHDIVAHHLAVIVVQAGAGRMAAPGPADRAADRFRTIRQSGGQALAEMARLVDILHTDVSEYGGTRLRMLLDRADAGGLRLRATPLPPYVRLPAEVEDVAYHVVQEGLTNAMKHAPGTEVQVRLTAAAGCLEVEVRNERASVASPLAGTGAGMGLAGMRERVESLAGELTAEPVNSGGFRVQARLPLAARELSPSR